jgi:hypothetical protein
LQRYTNLQFLSIKWGKYVASAAFNLTADGQCGIEELMSAQLSRGWRLKVWYPPAGLKSMGRVPQRDFVSGTWQMFGMVRRVCELRILRFFFPLDLGYCSVNALLPKVLGE